MGIQVLYRQGNGIRAIARDRRRAQYDPSDRPRSASRAIRSERSSWVERWPVRPAPVPPDRIKLEAHQGLLARAHRGDDESGCQQQCCCGKSALKATRAEPRISKSTSARFGRRRRMNRWCTSKPTLVGNCKSASWSSGEGIDPARIYRRAVILAAARTSSSSETMSLLPRIRKANEGRPVNGPVF